MTYKAIVARIRVTEVEGAKTLSQGYVLGYPVAVDKATEDGSLVLFFPYDGCLSTEFAEANDLVHRGTDPVTGARLGGYFGPKRRVTAQKFFNGKIISEGFACPLSFLDFAGGGSFEEGMEFDTWNGTPICSKYVNEATLKAAKNHSLAKYKRYATVNFPQHVDTVQWKKAGWDIKHGSVVYITEKLHGTSGRMANVKVDRPRTWLEWLLRRTPRADYKILHGSRRVILGESKDVNLGYYNDHTFRYNVMKDVVLEPDEIIYYEIVGYVSPDKPIMADHHPTDKRLVNLYGDTIRYDYGQANGTHKAYVYRITRNGVDLSWTQVLHRAKHLGLDTVPEFTRFIHYSHEMTQRMVDQWTDGYSILCDKHIREGVCLRVEHEDTGITFIKNKSTDFGILEGFIKADDTVVDLEEAS